MDPFSFPPLALLLDLTASALGGLSALLAPVSGSLSAALAIVVVTLLVRAALIPVGVSQARAEQTRARLAPRIRLLHERHGSDPERLQRETMKLYRDENASPLAGCVPLLIQAPIVGLLYTVFIRAEISGHANTLLDASVFGVPLGSSLAGTVASGTAGLSSLAVFGCVVLVIAGVGEVTRRLFRVADAPAALAGALGAAQYATAVVAVFVPLAAGLYLAVTVAWTLAQRIVLRRRYPLPPTGR